MNKPIFQSFLLVKYVIRLFGAGSKFKVPACLPPAGKSSGKVSGSKPGKLENEN
jgi:hypothetical protein